MDDGSERSTDSVPGASAGAEPHGVFAVLQSSLQSRLTTVHLCLMQLPAQWWVPAYKQGADPDLDISLSDIIQAQLAANAEFLYLPKLLLILYQMTK